VLTDEQADEIRRELEAGVRGPVLLKWVRLLLDDRDERLGRSPPEVRLLGRGRPGHSPFGCRVAGPKTVLTWLGTQA
jgi:hypothetical protein